MRLLHLLALALGLPLLAACQTSDLMEPPVPLGEFALGLNVAVADNVQKVPISRDATPEAWEAAMKKAIADRFGRYEGTKLYNIGISIDAYALAPPGVPLVLKPKSVLVVTANVWDDGAEKKLNAEGKQFTIFEKMSPETVIGSGVTQTKQKQMEVLSYNAAKKVEDWFLQNPEWFGLPPKGSKPAVVEPVAVVTPALAPAVVVAPVGVAPVRPAKPGKSTKPVVVGDTP